jgi:pimeloyl-ACP methyl ester carboxylesterase
MPPDPPRRGATAPLTPDPSTVPPPDADAAPDGFLVLGEGRVGGGTGDHSGTDDRGGTGGGGGGVRLHFLDWGGPPDAAGVLLVPGLLAPAWSWTPVARRLAAARRVVVTDLRGHGLSDAPMAGYDPGTLAADALAVANGAGLVGDGRLVVAGHGFGAIVAAHVASALGPGCAGVVLVDGGWERLEAVADVDVEEFLRGLDEPPEVMRSLPAYLDDRRNFDPATWDDDQERAARESIVETAAGHVVRVVRPHVVEAVVRAMFDYEPLDVLPALEVPVVALAARGDAEGRRDAELERVASAVVAAGRPPVRLARFPADGHNLMRYRPGEVAAAILGLAELEGGRR